VKQLSPVYTWLVCLTCFFMLLASNGMAELFADVANHAEHALSTSHRLYQKQKIANGVGSVMILTVVLKMLDKVYYREQLLPPVVFDWLEQFYEHPNKAAKAGNHHSGNGRTAPVPTDSSPVVTPPRAPKRSFGLTWKDVFRCFCGWTEPEEVPNEVLHADGTVAYVSPLLSCAPHVEPDHLLLVNLTAQCVLWHPTHPPSHNPAHMPLGGHVRL